MRKFNVVLLAIALFFMAGVVVAGTLPAGLPTPLRHYGMDETSGTTAIDATGAQNGTYTGTVTLGAVAKDVPNYETYTAVDYAGDGNGMTIGSGLGQLTDNFSVAAWVKPDGVDKWQCIASSDGWSTRSWGLLVDPYNHLRIAATGGDIDSGPFLTSGDIGQWVHVGVTYDHTNGTSFYKNGDFLGTVTGSHNYAITASSDSFRLGYGWDGVTDAQWNGAMDEFLVFNTVLTGGQMEALAGVPEPSAVIMVITGLLGLLAYAWRKRK